LHLRVESSAAIFPDRGRCFSWRGDGHPRGIDPNLVQPHRGGGTWPESPVLCMVGGWVRIFPGCCFQVRPRCGWPRAVTNPSQRAINTPACSRQKKKSKEVGAATAVGQPSRRPRREDYWNRRRNCRGNQSPRSTRKGLIKGLCSRPGGSLWTLPPSKRGVWKAPRARIVYV